MVKKTFNTMHPTINVWYPFIIPVVVLALGAPISLLHPSGGFVLFASAVLLGFRHAFDADHIATIDNVVRKLTSEGKESKAVGMLFSFGHSTVVVSFMLLVGIMGSGLVESSPQLSTIAGFSTFFVALFLTFIAIVNMLSLSRGGSPQGILTSLFGRVIDKVSHQKHLYLVGLLFGLGLDTALALTLLASASLALGSSSMVPLWVLTLGLGFVFAGAMSIGDSIGTYVAQRAYSGWGAGSHLAYQSAVTAVLIVVAGSIASLIWMEVFGLNVELGLLEYSGIVLVITAVFLIIWQFLRKRPAFV